jgi:hypothetical protein
VDRVGLASTTGVSSPTRREVGRLGCRIALGESWLNCAQSVIRSYAIYASLVHFLSDTRLSVVLGAAKDAGEPARLRHVG